ncbi:MAG: hypothetical protein U5L76_01015 [Patescibacteria group bacterium]|nr:hypothetical protein [Patescibacteria group bacterium]
MKKLKVLLIDIDNFLETQILKWVFLRKGIQVVRPDSQKELLENFPYDLRKWEFRPDFVLVTYYNFSQLTWLISYLRNIESIGIRVVNSTENIELFTDYLRRSQILSQKGYQIPNFYHGCSSKIPEHLGKMVVCKTLKEHQTFLCPRTGIHSLNSPIFVESCIANPKKKILTIYYVDGLIWARWKEDALQTKKRNRELITDLSGFAEEKKIVGKIAQDFGLVFFNVEFVEGYVIDVNTIANLFYSQHLQPLEALADWFLNQ